MKDGTSTLHYYGANSCDRTALVRQVMELCFSCFVSRHSCHPVISGASSINFTSSINSTSINIVKTFMGVSH